jgi:hypothetical protein
MFIGTEFGVFVTRDAGRQLGPKLAAGMPTIPIRDIQIQRRENDVVAASFGRGFFVLDDYTALRQIEERHAAARRRPCSSPADAHWYFAARACSAARKRGSQGDQLYVADNPPFGAVLTYHLAEGYPDPREAAAEGREGTAR